jgi:hypothetical protein
VTNRSLRRLARELNRASRTPDTGERQGLVTSFDMLTRIAQVQLPGGVVAAVTFAPDAPPAVGNTVIVANRGPDYYITTPGFGSLAGTTSSVGPNPPPPPPPPPPPTSDLLYPSSTTWPGSGTFT